MYCIIIIKILPEWGSVERDSRLEFDLGTYPLQIETESLLGSGEKIVLRFWGEGNTIGDITIEFGVEVTYSISSCTSTQMKFNSLPEDDNKVWTIRKTENSLTIECNDALVLEYLFASSENSQCNSNWSQDIDTIMFQSLDTASVRYRAVGTG